MLWQHLNGVMWIILDIYHSVRPVSCTPAENSSTVTMVYILSVSQVFFYKFKFKISTRKVLFKQLGNVCLISQICADNDSIKLLTLDVASVLI